MRILHSYTNKIETIIKSSVIVLLSPLSWLWQSRLTPEAQAQKITYSRNTNFCERSRALTLLNSPVPPVLQYYTCSLLNMIVPYAPQSGITVLIIPRNIFQLFCSALKSLVLNRLLQLKIFWFISCNHWFTFKWTIIRKTIYKGKNKTVFNLS